MLLPTEIQATGDFMEKNEFSGLKHRVEALDLGRKQWVRHSNAYVLVLSIISRV